MQTILIVDDEPNIVEGLASQLQQNYGDRAIVLRAYSGTHALSILRENQVDVVLSDICMPDLDGLSLMEETESLWPRAHFIFLSGFDDFQYIHRASKSPLYRGYLLKMEGDEVVLQKVDQEIRLCEEEARAELEQEEARRQVERIAANPYFTFGGYIRQDEADEVLRTGEVGAVVVFADDYDRRTAGSGEPDGAAIQLIFDASNPNDASSGAGYLRSVLLAEGTGGAPTPELHLLYNPQMKSSYNFVPGLMGLIFMLICAMMTSVSIVREKETGTMEVLLVSPVRPLRIVVAKMIPYFLLSCVNLATILLLARFVLGVPMSGSVVGLVGLSLLYLVLALALGLFISTMADSQVTAMLISGMLLILPLIMLSGMVFPIENMPGVLQGISCIVPARWYIEAVRKLMVEGLPFAAVLKEFAVLAVMTGALIGVALGKFNDKLE